MTDLLLKTTADITYQKKTIKNLGDMSHGKYGLDFSINDGRQMRIIK